MKVPASIKIGVAAMALMIAPASSAFAAENPEIANTVIALAKAQWAAGIAGKSGAVQNETVAEDYTEFNPALPTRLDGKAMSTKMAEVFNASSEKTVFADMINPKVQVYGDTAILTYNYVGVSKGSDGVTSPNAAKSTRVYAKTNGAWKLVHAHFTTVSTD